MTQTQSKDTTEIIIRFSSAWWIYMFARGGILRVLVNGIEDTLAITGRTLLLIFLLYCGVKSGALLVKPDWVPPVWLEMGMFVLQLAGLEGSIPGLARYADALHHKDDKEDAKNVEHVMTSARIMTVLTIGEGVLHLFGIDLQILHIISGILLLVRGVVITNFLMELAKIDAKGPRIVSKDEYAREEQARQVESEQNREIDNLHFQFNQAQTTQQQAHQQQHEQASMIQGLHDQIASMEKIYSATIASVDGQTQMLTDLQNRLGSAEQQTHNVAALLEQKCREVERVNAALQDAKMQIAKLQSADNDTIKTSEQIADLNNITSLDQARTKYDTDGQSRTKVSHADVLAFMVAHPSLKRTEVAVQLEISERKVYDAVAWGRDQELKKHSTHR